MINAIYTDINKLQYLALTQSVANIEQNIARESISPVQTQDEAIRVKQVEEVQPTYHPRKSMDGGYEGKSGIFIDKRV